MRQLIVVAVLVFSAATAAAADPIEEAGRGILARAQDAVVSVKVTVKESMAFEGHSSQKHDSTVEATGTCVDPSGLVVVSLRTIDRSEMMGSFSMGFGEDSFKSKYDAEITDVKIIVGASTEIPARIVLRDKDLDLAFVRPVEKPAKPFAALDLSQEAKPRLFEQVFIVDRMGKPENRQPVGLLSRIGSIIEKPRTFYIATDLLTALTLGSPAFTPDGKLVGLMVYRIQPMGRRESSDAMSMGRGGMTPGILPAADVLDVLKQALATPDKAPDKKEEKKDEKKKK
jgi:hypothetical protein